MDPDRLAVLRGIRLFVLDMDGTFYLGDRVLPGAPDFLQAAADTGRDYLFFTNNSSKAPADYLHKLAGMGCPVGREKLMTSGDVTIRYLRTCCPGKTVYLVGTPPLEQSFAGAGIPLTNSDPAVQPDLVVVGFDTTLNYRKLERACTFIRQGAQFLATHPDINCPTETGFIPDCGAICAGIALSTGVRPRYLGKPFAETVQMVAQHSGVPPARMAFVGDRLYTDVAAGVNNGAKGLLVLTGETKEADIPASPVQPDGVYLSLGEMAELLRKTAR